MGFVLNFRFSDHVMQNFPPHSYVQLCVNSQGPLNFLRVPNIFSFILLLKKYSIHFSNYSEAFM